MLFYEGLYRGPIRSPLRFFRCQGFKHVASVCRRDITQCEKCVGGNSHKECTVGIEKALYVNCGGAHAAGDPSALKDRLRLPEFELGGKFPMLRQGRE